VKCNYTFRLTIAVMKPTADIFLVPNATNEMQCN